MRKVKEVLRLKYDCGLSHQQIADACRLSKGVVGKYAQMFQASGLAWDTAQTLDEDELERALVQPRASTVSRYAQPDFHAIHQELKRKGVTLQLLWEEYRESCPGQPYQYTQFSVLYRRWRDAQKRSMRQVHRAGEKVFVDFSGSTLPIVDGTTGEIHPAQLFVAVLGASGYTYVEAVASQQLPDWIGAHVRMFAFFDGVPELVVPDNLKAGVHRACFYEPELNRTYADMAAHYGTAILPARPYKPKDKSKVENGVLLAQRWILARLRKRTFFGLAEANAAVAELLAALNIRALQRQRDESRRSLFDKLDHPALRPLPAAPYEYAEWRRARVNVDYHIEVDRHCYSVPHQLVKAEVDVRLTARAVEVLYRGKRVASHARHYTPGRHTTVIEHMPKAHQKHLEWTPERLVNWGVAIGPNTAAIVRHLLESKPHPEQGYRACLGLLNLAKRYGGARLEAACAYARKIGANSRKQVASILAANLDQHPDLFTPANTSLPTHDNVRGADYYH